MKYKTKKKREWCEGADTWVEQSKRKIVRCPVCNKRLLTRTIYCVGGEFVGYKIPPHKEK